MSEVWRDIPSAPGYQASDQGRIRSKRKTVRCGAGGRGRRCVGGEVLRPGRSSGGHFTVVVARAGGSRTVHSLVAEAFIGACPEGCEVLHRNGNPSDNRPSNLRYGTRSENNRDITRHNRRKLTTAQVKEARSRWEAGETQTTLAKEYGVCVSQMGNIVHRRQYERV